MVGKVLHVHKDSVCLCKSEIKQYRTPFKHEKIALCAVILSHKWSRADTKLWRKWPSIFESGGLDPLF